MIFISRDMHRRSFLAAAATGAAVGLSGCLGGHVEKNVNERVSVAANGGEWWEIPDIGSAEIGYSFRSDDNWFQVFYFREQAAFEQYQSYVMTGESESQPRGDAALGGVAVSDGGDVFEVENPDDGRTSVTVDEPHYIAVDYSDYHDDMGVSDHDDPIQVTVDLEIVDPHIDFL